jgi:hypothetical protein
MAIDLWKREEFEYEGYTHEGSHSSRDSDQDQHNHNQRQQLLRDEHEPQFYVPSLPPPLSHDREPVTSSDEVSFSSYPCCNFLTTLLAFAGEVQE